MTHGLALGALALCLSTGAVAAHPFDGAVSASLSESTLRADLSTDEARQRLISLSTELFDLDATSLRETAAERRGDGEQEVVNAIILRAGRPIPPGLSAARKKQRAKRAVEGSEWLAEEMKGLAGRRLVVRSLESALSSPADGSPSQPALAVAAMRASITLDLNPTEIRGIAPKIAKHLDRNGSDEVRAVAVETLFEFFGRWFTSSEGFHEVWPVLQGADATALGRDALFAAEARASVARLRLVEYAPDRQLDDPLQDPSSATAAAAARAIGRAVARGTLRPDEALQWLGEGLSDETRPRPLHARIETLLDLIQGAEPNGEAATEVRRLLVGLATPEGALHSSRAWAAIGGLPRLVYGEGVAGDTARAAALDVGTKLFARLVDRSGRRLLDPDALQGAVTSLSDLARAIEDEAVRSKAARPLVALFGAFVTDRRPVPLGVRRAAASGLTLAIEPEDALELVAIVNKLKTPEIEYELLGALRAAIGVLGDGAPEKEAVLDELFEATTRESYDQRARAIGVLNSGDLAKEFAARPRRKRAFWTIDRIKEEPSEELRLKLTTLLGSLGDRGMLTTVLEDTDLLQMVAAGGVESIKALEGALGELSEEDASSMRTAARGMAGIVLPAVAVDPGIPDAESSAASGDVGALDVHPLRIELLRAAVQLMITADEIPEAIKPSLADRGFTVRTTLELLRIAPQIGATGLIASEREAVMRRHVIELADDSEESQSLDEFELRAVRGLLGARAVDGWDFKAAPEPGTVAEIEQSIQNVVADFDAAVRLLPAAAENPGGWTEAALQLECIEFLVAAQKPETALRRFDPWIDAEADSDSVAARSYVELVTAHAATLGEGAELDPARITRVSRLLREAVTGASELPPAEVRSVARWLTDVVLEGDRGAQRLRTALGGSPEGQDILNAMTALVEGAAPEDSETDENNENKG